MVVRLLDHLQLEEPDEFLRNPSSTLNSLASLLCLPQLLLTIIASNCSTGGRRIGAKRGRRAENRATGQIILLCFM